MGRSVGRGSKKVGAHGARANPRFYRIFKDFRPRIELGRRGARAPKWRLTHPHETIAPELVRRDCFSIQGLVSASDWTQRQHLGSIAAAHEHGSHLVLVQSLDEIVELPRTGHVGIAESQDDVARTDSGTGGRTINRVDLHP
jgi:hypothetical protein